MSYKTPNFSRAPFTSSPVGCCCLINTFCQGDRAEEIRAHGVGLEVEVMAGGGGGQGPTSSLIIQPASPAAP